MNFESSADRWEDIAERYQPGTIVRVKVTRIFPFGIRVELEPGVEGLVHVSELSDAGLDPWEVVTVGDEVQAKVLRVDQVEHRIGLSCKRAAWSQ